MQLYSSNGALKVLGKTRLQDYISEHRINIITSVSRMQCQNGEGSNPSCCVQSWIGWYHWTWRVGVSMGWYLQLYWINYAFLCWPYFSEYLKIKQLLENEELALSKGFKVWAIVLLGNKSEAFIKWCNSCHCSTKCDV